MREDDSAREPLSKYGEWQGVEKSIRIGFDMTQIAPCTKG
jgi:hypothetical protein